MKNFYDTIKNEELLEINNDWSFAETMQTASRNEKWRRKEGLWTLLSAACDDAAKKCYSYINSFSEKLIDIDTCNIHSLKSIAKSVNLDYLTDDIIENYPDEIMDLINIFSVPKHLLLNTNKILLDESNNKLERKNCI